MNHREDPWEPLEGYRPNRDCPMPLGDDKPQDEDEPLSFQTMRRIELIARLHHMAFSTRLQEGLPPAQAGALKIIAKTPGLSQRALADALHIQRATATVMLQKMEKAGFIERRPDPEDQRISRIYPTEAAKVLDAENHKNFLAYFARAFDNFSDQELRQMFSSLEKLRDNLRGFLDDTEYPEHKE